MTRRTGGDAIRVEPRALGGELANLVDVDALHPLGPELRGPWIHHQRERHRCLLAVVDDPPEALEQQQPAAVDPAGAR